MSKLTKEEEEEELLKAFEEMIGIDGDQEDFGYFGGQAYPSTEDLEYPAEPPPIPPEALKNNCNHKETEEVFYTQNNTYLMCKKCKADLGDKK